MAPAIADGEEEEGRNMDDRPVPEKPEQSASSAKAALDIREITRWERMEPGECVGWLGRAGAGAGAGAGAAAAAVAVAVVDVDVEAELISLTNISIPPRLELMVLVLVLVLVLAPATA